jgi:hypothetical protein
MVSNTLRNKFSAVVVPCSILRLASSSTTSEDYVMPWITINNFAVFFASLLSSGASQKLSNSFSLFLSLSSHYYLQLAATLLHETNVNSIKTVSFPEHRNME